MRILMLVVLLGGAVSVSAQVPPPNDDCANATAVGALPFTDAVDTTLARPAPTDTEWMFCGPGDGPTVWYEFVPPADGDYCARTCGSDYDTVLGALTGTCLGGQAITCDDDTCDFESQINFPGTAGIPVLMVVGAYEFSPQAALGGYLSFSVQDAAADSDGDGILDCDDNCVETANALQPDIDADGLGDVCETCTGIGGNGQDTDADGFCGYVDRCPFVSDPGQADADGDFTGDACDQCAGAGGIDQDLDGVCDDAGDNCPSVANPGQLDADGDFLGDACDGCPGFPGGGTVDSDGDTVPDACDACPNDAADACATIWGCIAEPFSSSADSLLVRVNPATGVTRTVGALGTPDCRALAFEPGTGRLLAIARSILDDTTFDLFEVDPSTAAVTRIGKVADGPGNYTGGMAFRSDGTLFANLDQSISIVDPLTGASTHLGFGGDYPAGLAFDASDRLLIAASSAWLGEVDQTTGTTTELPYPMEPLDCPSGFDDFFGLAFTNDTFYLAFTCYPSSLLGTVDPATGVVVTTGRTPEHLNALTAEVCGNGTREGGEECDDGNPDPGDCCSPTCRTGAAGTPCPDDGSLCTTDTCDGAGFCAHTVPAAAGCTMADPGRASLAISGGPDPRLAWKWRGTIGVFMAFGLPQTSTDMVLCLADASGTLLADATAPSGGVCLGGHPCWKPSSAGYTYKDVLRTPDGIERMTLVNVAAPGKSKLKVKGRSPNLGLAAIPYTAPLRVRLLRDDDSACWEATYSSTRRNDTKKLRAISD